MDNCTNHFENILTSSSHANFRLHIFHSKTLLYSFWGGKTVQKLTKYANSSHLNICLNYHIFIHLLIEYEDSHLTPVSCTSVKYTQQFCLIV